MKNLVIFLTLLIGFGSFKADTIAWTALGDSITYLNDHPDETGNRVSQGYMTRVIEKLPNIHYINQGHNGWTAVKIAQEIETLGLVKSDVYSIFLGTNDWWGGKPLGRLADYRNRTGSGTVNGSFRIIIDKLRSLNPTARIILITPMQRGDFVYLTNFKNNASGSYKPKNGQTLESFAQAIDSIGRFEQLPVIDLYHTKSLAVKKLVKFKRLKDPQTGAYHNYPYPTYTTIPFTPETDEYPYPPDAINMTYDGLHPSNKGNAVISKQLVKVMKGYLVGRKYL
ncbi:MAG: SGNH/GDSL hydrolase family protein [Spirosoma sp.]|nr:SGNH/GDSL hydrolase family protein [Spirosoma sp.]